MFTLVIYSARNLDCRNRRMRFQHRDYDNGRYLDEPNFRSNFIHQSTYSTVKSSLVQDQGNTSLKYIESQSRLLLIFVRLPNTPRQTKRAKDHRRKQSDKEGDRKILHAPDPSSSKFEGSSLRAGRSAVSQPLRTDCVHSSYL